MNTNDVLLIATLRLIQAWDSDNVVVGSPAFNLKMHDLRKAASIYEPIDKELVNRSLSA